MALNTLFYLIIVVVVKLNFAHGTTNRTGKGTVCKSRAYVTLVTNDAYAAGAIVLGRSLSAVEGLQVRAPVCPAPKRVVLIPADTTTLGRKSKTLLAETGWQALEVAAFEKPREDPSWFYSGTRDLSLHYLGLRAFELTQFDRLIVVDADGIALRPLEKMWDDRFFLGNISARLERQSKVFNAALMMIRPNLDVVDWALQLKGHNGTALQGLLNQLFASEWQQKPENQRVPGSWHFGMAACVLRSWEENFKQSRDAKLFDFQGSTKPWYWQGTGMSYQNCQSVEVFFTLWQSILLSPPSTSPSVISNWIESLIGGSPESSEIAAAALQVTLTEIKRNQSKELRDIYSHLMPYLGSMGNELTITAKTMFGEDLGGTPIRDRDEL